MKNICSNLYFILFCFILFCIFAFDIQILNQKSKNPIQMKQTFNFLLMLVMVATVFSCKKKQDVLPKIVGKYKMTVNTSTITTVASGAITTDNNLVRYPTCTNDDTQEYTSDGKLTFNDGAVLCPLPVLVAGVTATYVLSADEKTLTETYTKGTFSETNVLTVVELTDTILRTTSKSYVYLSSIDNNGVETIVANAVDNITLTKI